MIQRVIRECKILILPMIEHPFLCPQFYFHKNLEAHKAERLCFLSLCLEKKTMKNGK